MVNVVFTNEKGNVSVKVRDGIRKQVLAKMANVLAGEFDDAELNANGGVSFPVAVDTATGMTVYAHLDLTISTKDPKVKVEKKSKSKAKSKAEPVEVPDLFESEPDELA